MKRSELKEIIREVVRGLMTEGFFNKGKKLKGKASGIKGQYVDRVSDLFIKKAGSKLKGLDPDIRSELMKMDKIVEPYKKDDIAGPVGESWMYDILKAVYEKLNK
jgi:hypothetical protein